LGGRLKFGIEEGFFHQFPQGGVKGKFTKRLEMPMVMKVCTEQVNQIFRDQKLSCFPDHVTIIA
jgi:hypothetical protein